MAITNAREKIAFSLTAMLDAEQQLFQGMEQFQQVVGLLGGDSSQCARRPAASSPTDSRSSSNATAQHFAMATYRGLLLAVQESGEQEMQQQIQQIIQQEEQPAQEIGQAMPRIIKKAMQMEASPTLSSYASGLCPRTREESRGLCTALRCHRISVL